ncbi:14120_t:CDS:2, partial [Acaulospora morrowiae]
MHDLPTRGKIISTSTYNISDDQRLSPDQSFTPIIEFYVLPTSHVFDQSYPNKSDVDDIGISNLKSLLDEEKRSHFKDANPQSAKETSQPTISHPSTQGFPSDQGSDKNSETLKVSSTATEEYDQFLLNFSNEAEPLKPVAEEEEDTLLNLIKTSKGKQKPSSTQKSSNADVAKLLSDFLLPSEELYRIHIHASYNNTIVTLTNSRKDVLITTSGGIVGFKKAQRGGYEAAHRAAVGLIEKIKDKRINVRNVEILVN